MGSLKENFSFSEVLAFKTRVNSLSLFLFKELSHFFLAHTGETGIVAHCSFPGLEIYTRPYAVLFYPSHLGNTLFWHNKRYYAYKV